MTGPSGNRQNYLPLEIQDRLPKSSYAPRSIETLGDAILNLSGPVETSLETIHYLFTVSSLETFRNEGLQN